MMKSAMRAKRKQRNKKTPRRRNAPRSVKKQLPIRKPANRVQSVACGLSRQQIISLIGATRRITEQDLHMHYHFSRKQWEQFRDEMIDCGYAEEISDNVIRKAEFDAYQSGKR
jgi:hypothetical protein